MTTTSRTLRTLVQRTAAFAACFALLAVTVAKAADAPVAASKPAATKTTTAQPRIQIAILLDTSNSMDGLINQVRQQLWKIVNEFATAKQNGKSPKLEVALLQYGNNRLPAKEGYIELVTGFTDNLDLVSQKLLALKTSGGSEYCGQVIDVAVKSLNWSKSHSDLKTIYIAGNERFTQGPVDFRKACPTAIKRGIIVNTIFCGAHAEGISTHWKDGATLADGAYMNIDQNEVSVTINAPQDAEILRLGERLNTTYVAYGAAGARGANNQVLQDSNALSLGRAFNVSRQVAKSSHFYKAKGWDLVDAVEEGEVDLEKLEDESLPAELRGKTPEELQEFVEAKKREREEIQKKIQELNESRKTYISAEMKKRGESDSHTLDSAMIKAVKEQAQKRNFTFKK